MKNDNLSMTSVSDATTQMAGAPTTTTASVQAQSQNSTASTDLFDAAHQRFMSRRSDFIDGNPGSVSPQERDSVFGFISGLEGSSNEREQMNLSGVLRDQLNTSMKTARAAVMNRIRGVSQVQSQGVMKASDLAKQPSGRFDLAGRELSNDGSVISGQQPNVPVKNGISVVGGAAAQQAGVTMRQSGNIQVPSYMRGNTQIDLPSDMNLNDDSAVSMAIEDRNMLVDFMDNNTGNDEEV